MAVKIYGTFKHMHVRMMPAQQPPYTRLIDSARRQPEEKRQDIGAIVGFFTPELFHGVGSAGFHIHFAEMKELMVDMFLTLKVDDVVVEIQNFETFQQHFPVNNETFVKAKIDYKDVAEEIREAE
ncbi:acetolactate decarboxylase [Staphylococcus aureus]